MSAEHDAQESLKQTTRSIADHKGVVSVHPVPGKPSLEIEYDPSALSEDDLRRIAESHPMGPALQKRTLRLDGKACEACAIRLERKMKSLPGVRKATATYIGKILCLTFDETLADEKTVMEGIRATGAKVSAYEPPSLEAEQPLWQRIRSGSLNEELSCALGFLFPFRRSARLAT